MSRQSRTILIVVTLVLVALPAFAAPEPQRIERNGFGLEIRYEPIPGVALHPAEVSPVPVGEIGTALTPAGYVPVAAEPEILRTSGFEPIPGAARPIDEVAPLDGVNPIPQVGVRLETGHSSTALEAGDVTLVPAGIAALPDRRESGQDAMPNLVFFAPTGWDFPIVPSDVQGTHTVGPDLNDGDSTWFDFAVANTGTATAQPRFYTYLFSDGLVIAGFYTDSLPVGFYAYYQDYGRMMPAGAHLIAGFTDSTDVIAESLETDNRWSHSWNWRFTGGALPNLTPYTPTGWDYPIVPSDVRNTRTEGPDLNDFDTTFVDWAIINNGNATAQPLFYVYLYLDSHAIAGWTCDSLPYMYYLHADDDPEFVPAGTHTLGTVGDSTNTVTESNEADNHYSRAFNWRHDPATLANLAAFLPDGWDFPIVPSNLSGTNTVGPDLNDQESTWVDLAFANLGNYTAKPRFYVYLYWETTPVAGWFLDSLEPMSYVPIEDRAFRFPAGSHTLSYVLDSLAAVTESNENDNHYLNTFVWRHVGVPELVAYTPTGWDFPIVPANVRNTNTVGPDLNDADTTFVDWSVANLGSATARPAFYTYLYVDNVPIAGWLADSLPPFTYMAVADYPRFVASGQHALATLTDSTNVIAESLENNNRYSHNFTWRHVSAALPNLTPYQPTGWDFPIVPSNVRGTHTVGPDLNDEDTTFVDFAFANNGRVTAQPRFYTYLYSDGIPFAGFFTDSLPAGFYASTSDVTEFFTYGNHELGVFVDSTGVVAESSEADNTWFHTFAWSHHSGIAAPAIVPSAFDLMLGANPVCGLADVAFSLPTPEPVVLAAYDRTGRVVAELVQGMQSAGTHRVSWNTDRLASGVYLLKLETASGRRCVKTVTRL